MGKNSLTAAAIKSFVKQSVGFNRSDPLQLVQFLKNNTGLVFTKTANAAKIFNALNSIHQEKSGKIGTIAQFDVFFPRNLVEFYSD
jgi:ribosomal protein L10